MELLLQEELQEELSQWAGELVGISSALLSASKSVLTRSLRGLKKDFQVTSYGVQKST